MQRLTDSIVRHLAEWRAARGRAVALRVEPIFVSPLTGIHPSRKHCRAGPAGGDDNSGPFPCPGIAGLVSRVCRSDGRHL
jgi:hypothetical protein